MAESIKRDEQTYTLPRQGWHSQVQIMGFNVTVQSTLTTASAADKVRLLNGDEMAV